MPLDFTKGSISQDFAEKVAGGIIFTDYHYYESLATGTAYTPPIHTQALLLVGNGDLSGGQTHVDFYDGASWIPGHAGILENYCHTFQDNDQNIRVYNSTSAKKISLTGVTWISGFADYHYYADLSANTTYTPPAKAIASFFNVKGELEQAFIAVQFWTGAAWVNAFSGGPKNASMLIQQDNDQNIRIENDWGAAYKISLTGVIRT